MKKVRLIDAASAFPEKRLTNADLENMVDTNDEWIRDRTGIRERRIVMPGQGSSDLAYEASTKLLEKIGKKASDVEAIIVGTVTPDTPVPSTACILQDKLGARKAWCFDINAACSGFLYSLSAAHQFLRTGHTRNALVVGVDVMTSILNFEDRNTCVLFGDGCGAVYLEASETHDTRGIIDTMMLSDGAGREFLRIPAGGSKEFLSEDIISQKRHLISQEGKQVFKSAVVEMARISEEILERNNISSEEIKYFVPHQANIRIIESCAKRLKLPEDKIVLNIGEYGNTTAGTIPSCLAKLSDEMAVKKGDLLLLAAFGAGYTSSSALLEWN